MSYNKSTGEYEGYIYMIYNDINEKVYIGQTSGTIHHRWNGHKSCSRKDSHSTSYIHRAMHKYGEENFHIKVIKTIKCKNANDLKSALDKYEKQYIREYHSLSIQNGYNIETGGTGSSRRIRKAIVQYDIDLNYINTYKDSTIASTNTGIPQGSIQNCCNHQLSYAGAYIWTYQGEEPRKIDFNNLIRLGNFVSTARSFGNIPDDYWNKIANIYYMKNGIRCAKVIKYYVNGVISEIYTSPLDMASAINTKVFPIKEILIESKSGFHEGYVYRYFDIPFDKSSIRNPYIPIKIEKEDECMIFNTVDEIANYLDSTRYYIRKAMKYNTSVNGYRIIRL